MSTPVTDAPLGLSVDQTRAALRLFTILVDIASRAEAPPPACAQEQTGHPTASRSAPADPAPSAAGASSAGQAQSTNPDEVSDGGSR